MSGNLPADLTDLILKCEQTVDTTLERIIKSEHDRALKHSAIESLRMR